MEAIKKHRTILEKNKVSDEHSEFDPLRKERFSGSLKENGNVIGIQNFYAGNYFVMVQQLNEIKILLNKIERTYAAERSITIGQLQDKIWNDNFEIENEYLQDLLSNLATDLNFYEPVERDCDEGLGYFGDEKLLVLTNETLKKIDASITNK